MIGTLIRSRYRLEDQIGSGGMSTVYRAFDETLERWVAIKVLHGALADDPLQLERFRREARTIARLSHPHVVTVIDAGEDGGQPFIVLEYVDGETLKARVRRLGRLGVIEAIAYAIEIGRALTAAHALRLVHRDVKPQNVLINGDGRAKVTDFGISRSLEEDGLTATGRVLGTTDYVAPEQALGEGICEQSDIYSLGVCLYEMLTGEVPFKADSQVGVAMKHVREQLPDVRAARPEVSATLAAVVERATAKERDNRYASSAAMVNDLEQALGVETARASNPAAAAEATAVLRGAKKAHAKSRNGHRNGSRNGSTNGSVPTRPRRRGRRVALTLVLVTLIAAAAVAVELRVHRPSRAAKVVAPPAPAQVALAGASGFDPSGDGQEHNAQAPLAIDGDPTTDWSTEDYSQGQGLSKPGVGIYVQAPRPLAARQLEVLSPTVGAHVEIYAAGSPARQLSGWGQPVGAATLTAEQQRIPLAMHGRLAPYYLVWITRLPPTFQEQIAELKLFR